MPTTNAEELDCFHREAQKLRTAAEKAAKLIASQRQAIADQDLETLEAILQQKQPFIDQLLGFRHLQATYESLMSTHSISLPENFASTYSELNTKIQSLADADQQAISLLKDHHAELARELQLLMRDRHAASCYSQTLPPQSKSRIDISS